jgi:hypothetical protein
MTASPMPRAKMLGRMPANCEMVSDMTGTTVMQTKSKVSGSCAFACARPANARNMIRPMTRNRMCGVWLSHVVRKKASQAEMPIMMTNPIPTLGGGEKGRLESKTPVRTGARAEGCQPIYSQTRNDAVVATAKRSTKCRLAASVGSAAARSEGTAVAMAIAGSSAAPRP